jgi:hypothetical protein
MSQEVDLSSFLRGIADNIDGKKLDDKDIQMVGEFYMNWKTREDNTELTDKEYLKFFTLGWYVYTQILK